MESPQTTDDSDTAPVLVGSHTSQNHRFGQSGTPDGIESQKLLEETDSPEILLGTTHEDSVLPCYIGTNRYTYSPLPGSNFVRILHLFPATEFQSALEGSIETVNLDHRQQYSAFSYSWATETGDDSLSRMITIGGEEVSITVNLFNGLRRIRREKEELMIWIDALCINQEDPLERSHQVANMSRIYRQAQRVIVWLGEGENDEADKRMEGIFNRLAECSEKYLNDEHIRAVLHCSTDGWCPAETPSDHTHCKLFPANAFAAKTSYHLHASISSHPEYLSHYILAAVASATVFSKRYWTRRWIVQELYFARTLNWHWGACSVRNVKLTWLHLNNLAHLVNLALWDHVERVAGPIDMKSTMAGLRTVARLLRLREEKGWSRREGGSSFDVTLLNALRDTGGMNCRDPRDKVYALLGLCYSPPLTPDYSLTTAEVYTDFTRALIRAGRGYLVFKQFYNYSNRQRLVGADALSKELPSWVPDFRQNFDYADNLDEFGYYGPFDGTVSNDGTHLECDVYVLGTLGQDIDIATNGETNKRLVLSHGVPVWPERMELAFPNRLADEMLPGDLVCAFNKVLSTPVAKDIRPRDRLFRTMILVLRWVEGSVDTYAVVGTYYFYPVQWLKFYLMHIEAREDSHSRIKLV